MGSDYGERSETFTMRQSSYRLDEALGYARDCYRVPSPRGRQESYFPGPARTPASFLAVLQQA